jgi:transcription elongation factor Elf1
MRVVKNGKMKQYQVTCDVCGSSLVFDERDVQRHNGRKCLVCEACGLDTAVRYGSLAGEVEVGDAPKETP